MGGKESLPSVRIRCKYKAVKNKIPVICSNCKSVIFTGTEKQIERLKKECEDLSKISNKRSLFLTKKYGYGMGIICECNIMRDGDKIVGIKFMMPV